MSSFLFTVLANLFGAIAVVMLLCILLSLCAGLVAVARYLYDEVTKNHPRHSA